MIQGCRHFLLRRVDQRRKNRQKFCHLLVLGNLLEVVVLFEIRRKTGDRTRVRLGPRCPPGSRSLLVEAGRVAYAATARLPFLVVFRRLQEHPARPLPLRDPARDAHDLLRRAIQRLLDFVQSGLHGDVGDREGYEGLEQRRVEVLRVLRQQASLDVVQRRTDGDPLSHRIQRCLGDAHDGVNVAMVEIGQQLLRLFFQVIFHFAFAFQCRSRWIDGGATQAAARASFLRRRPRRIVVVSRALSPLRSLLLRLLSTTWLSVR